MKMNKIVITKFQCIESIQRIIDSNSLRPKKQKLGNFENVIEVLNEYGLSLTKPPVENELFKKWKCEKDKVISAFSRVLEERKKFERHKDRHRIQGNFFDSEEYKILTQPIIDTDPDFVIQSVSDVESDAVPKRKVGRPKMSLTDLGSTQLRKRTNEIYDVLLKECSDQNVSFDKLISKLALRYYFTPGENYDKKKGDMFNKVVTLTESDQKVALYYMPVKLL